MASNNPAPAEGSEPVKPKTEVRSYLLLSDRANAQTGGRALGEDLCQSGGMPYQEPKLAARMGDGR